MDKAQVQPLPETRVDLLLWLAAVGRVGRSASSNAGTVFRVIVLSEIVWSVVTTALCGLARAPVPTSPALRARV